MRPERVVVRGGWSDGQKGRRVQPRAGGRGCQPLSGVEELRAQGGRVGGLAHVVVRRGCRLEKVTVRAAAGGHDRIQQPHSRRASLIVRPHRARSITVARMLAV